MAVGKTSGEEIDALMVGGFGVHGTNDAKVIANVDINTQGVGDMFYAVLFNRCVIN